MDTDIKIRKFEQFSRMHNIVHGVFTRYGGVSRRPFDSLNIGKNSGDSAQNVAGNRKRIIMEMGMKPFVFLNQVHGVEIQVIKKGDKSLCHSFEPGEDTFTADAVITDMKDLFLVIQVADCQAVMLVDPEKEVIANIHSGWRGSINNIIGRCVRRMQDSFGCDSADILAGISPSLGPCCAEFVHYQKEIPKTLWKYKLPDRDYFDFWKMSRDQLADAGLRKESIENMNTCTKCHTNEFYSYRENNNTGRFACVISMVQ